MKHNLKTENGRRKAIEELENKTLALILNFCRDFIGLTLIRMDKYQVQLGLKEMDKKSSYFGRMSFASEVRVHTKAGSFYESESATISYGCSGSFTPEDKAQTFRTITAARILENWNEITNIVEIQCNEYRKLEKEILEVNN